MRVVVARPGQPRPFAAVAAAAVRLEPSVSARSIRRAARAVVLLLIHAAPRDRTGNHARRGIDGRTVRQPVCRILNGIALRVFRPGERQGPLIRFPVGLICERRRKDGRLIPGLRAAGLRAVASGQAKAEQKPGEPHGDDAKPSKSRRAQKRAGHRPRRLRRRHIRGSGRGRGGRLQTASPLQRYY